MSVATGGGGSDRWVTNPPARGGVGGGCRSSTAQYFERRQRWALVICARQPGGPGILGPQTRRPGDRARPSVARDPSTDRYFGRRQRGASGSRRQGAAVVGPHTSWRGDRARFLRGGFFGAAHFLRLGSQSFFPLDHPPGSHVKQTRIASPYGLGPIKPSAAPVRRGHGLFDHNSYRAINVLTDNTSMVVACSVSQYD